MKNKKQQIYPCTLIRITCLINILKLTLTYSVHMYVKQANQVIYVGAFYIQIEIELIKLVLFQFPFLADCIHSFFISIYKVHTFVLTRSYLHSI